VTGVVSTKNVGDLPIAANVAATDQVLVWRSPSGSPSLRLANAATLTANMVLAAATPANSTAAGVRGTVSFDGSYLYVCVLTNKWGRTALDTSTW